MRRLALAALMLAVGVAAEAGTPRSAIPWLSESVSEKFRGGDPKESGTEAGGALDVIESTPLSLINRDGVGIFSPASVGFPDDLWKNSSALRIRRLILSHPYEGVPAAREVFRNLLTVHAAPPRGSSGRALFFLARVDRLLEIGALDQARELIEAAGINDPETFRRYFDVGLLTGRAEAACRTIQASPSLSPTLQARVFCLARAGDWDAAALTLSLGTQLGTIPLDQGELLTYFLDPGLFGDEEEPPLPQPLTALDFVLREAVALPRPSEPLPLAFLQVDLSPAMPMRSRIVAGEKLVRSGAISAPRLFASYRAGLPAASGGVWERARAVQEADAAVNSGDEDRILRALSAVDDALSPFGLRNILASEYGGVLASLQPRPRSGSARRVFELLALDGRADAAERWQRGKPTSLERLSLALTTAGAIRLPPGISLSPTEQAIVSGLSADTSPGPEGDRLYQLLMSGRPGEAILGALALLAPGVEVDPGDLETALFVLRAAGQQNAARLIALQTLLMRPPT
ncbi:MAG: hypothetical protein ACE5FS_02530 [Paracoccaceae bacterium]